MNCAHIFILKMNTHVLDKFHSKRKKIHIFLFLI